MILRNKKKILNHLTEHGTICGTESLLSLNSEGFYVGLKNEEILGLELEYHYIDLDDLYKAYHHGNVYSGIKAIKSENF